MKRNVLFVIISLIACLGGAVVFHGSSSHIHAAAANKYISEVSTGVEDEGKDSLTEKGYSVISPSLVDGNGRNIWIGYKTTSVESLAVTDIRIKNTSGSISFETIKERGKAPVMDVRIVSADTNRVSDFDDVYPITNNGLVPMINPAGKVVSCDTINGKCYLALLKADIWKNYIGDVKVVKKNSKKAAIAALAEAGCEHYVDENFSSGDSYVYIGYTRTSDEKEAIKDIVALSRRDYQVKGYEPVDEVKVKGYYLYITRDENYGNAITDIESISDFSSMEITAKQWMDMVVATGDNASTKPYMIDSDDYKAMKDSKDVYVINRIYSEEDKDTHIVIISLKNELENRQSAKKELIKTAIEEAGPAKEDDEEEDETGISENAKENGSDGTDVNNDDQLALETSNESDVKVGGVVGDSESGHVDNMYNESGVTAEPGEDDETGENVENGENAENAEGIGTVKEDAGRFPGIAEVIVFIMLAVSIPVATYLIKKRLDGKKEQS